MSIFDHPDSVPAAPSWRCPHCGTLQAETSRCWRCTRSVVTCSTCYRYRTSVASGLGFCAMDRARAPLSGDEVRSCWEAAPAEATPPGLFEAVEPPPTPMAKPPPVTVRPRRRRAARPPKPPLEELEAAAWTEAPKGELVDAPHVEAGPPPSEVERRRWRFWRR